MTGKKRPFYLFLKDFISHAFEDVYFSFKGFINEGLHRWIAGVQICCALKNKTGPRVTWIGPFPAMGNAVCRADALVKSLF